MSDAGAAGERKESQAERFDRIAAEASLLGDHARVAASHFRSGEVARAAAHGLAAEGHLVAIRALLVAIASLHASRSRAVP